MFDVGPRKLKCGTEAGRGLAFASPKEPCIASLHPCHPPQRAALGGRGEGDGTERLETAAWIVQRFPGAAGLKHCKGLGLSRQQTVWGKTGDG